MGDFALSGTSLERWNEGRFFPRCHLVDSTVFEVLVLIVTVLELQDTVGSIQSGSQVLKM